MIATGLAERYHSANAGGDIFRIDMRIAADWLTGILARIVERELHKPFHER